MKLFIISIGLFIASLAQANFQGLKESPCDTYINNKLSDKTTVTPFFSHGLGQIKITGNVSKVRNTSRDNNVTSKLIVYNSKVPVFDSKGKLKNLKILKDNKVQFFYKDKKLIRMIKYGEGMRTHDPEVTEFTYQGNECLVNQRYFTKDPHNPKKQKYVNFDRQLCNEFMPELEKLGRKNLEACSGIFSRAILHIDQRNKDLSKENKELKLPTPFNINEKIGAKDLVKQNDIIGLLSSCMVGASGSKLTKQNYSKPYKNKKAPAPSGTPTSKNAK